MKYPKAKLVPIKIGISSVTVGIFGILVRSVTEPMMLMFELAIFPMSGRLDFEEDAALWTKDMMMVVCLFVGSWFLWLINSS